MAVDVFVNSKQATTQQIRLQNSNIDTRNYTGLYGQTTPKDWRKRKENKEEQDFYDLCVQQWKLNLERFETMPIPRRPTLLRKKVEGDKQHDFHDWSAKRMTHQRTAAKEKEKAKPVPRRLTLLAKNVEEEKEENDKQRVQQEKIAGYKIAKWIKTNYIRRVEEFDARITEETQIMLIEMEHQTRKETAAATIVNWIESHYPCTKENDVAMINTLQTEFEKEVKEMENSITTRFGLDRDPTEFAADGEDDDDEDDDDDDDDTEDEDEDEDNNEKTSRAEEFNKICDTLYENLYMPIKGRRNSNELKELFFVEFLELAAAKFGSEIAEVIRMDRLEVVHRKMMEMAAEHDIMQESDDLSIISMNSEDTTASDTMLIMKGIRHEMKWTDNAALRQTTITEFWRPVKATNVKPNAKRFKQVTLTDIWCIMSNTMNTKKTTTPAQNIILEDGNTKISGADDAACEPHISTGPTAIDKRNSKKKTRKKRRKKMQKKALARAQIKRKIIRHGNSKNGIHQQATDTTPSTITVTDDKHEPMDQSATDFEPEYKQERNDYHHNVISHSTDHMKRLESEMLAGGWRYCTDYFGNKNYCEANYEKDKYINDKIDDDGHYSSNYDSNYETDDTAIEYETNYETDDNDSAYNSNNNTDDNKSNYESKYKHDYDINSETNDDNDRNKDSEYKSNRHESAYNSNYNTEDNKNNSDTNNDNDNEKNSENDSDKDIEYKSNRHESVYNNNYNTDDNKSNYEINYKNKYDTNEDNDNDNTDDNKNNSDTNNDNDNENEKNSENDSDKDSEYKSNRHESAYNNNYNTDDNKSNYEINYKNKYNTNEDNDNDSAYKSNHHKSAYTNNYDTDETNDQDYDHTMKDTGNTPLSNYKTQKNIQSRERSTKCTSF